MVKSISFLLRKANQKQEAEVFFWYNGGKRPETTIKEKLYPAILACTNSPKPRYPQNVIKEASVTRAWGLCRVQIPSEWFTLSFAKRSATILCSLWICLIWKNSNWAVSCLQFMSKVQGDGDEDQCSHSLTNSSEQQNLNQLQASWWWLHKESGKPNQENVPDEPAHL